MVEFVPQQIKILIVDDTPENVELAGKVLEREGYDIYITNNGIEAEKIAREVNLDLILLDIMMPKQDGFTTCTHIRKIPGYASVPILFLSARIDIDSILKGFEMGAVDYIRKPFNIEELKSRVSTHTELRLYREELERRNEQLEKALFRIEEIARTDELTGLLNRRELIRIFEYEINRTLISKHEFALIMVDVDLFKQVNDTFGHITGDTVLKTIAEVLQKHARKQDYLARWGGDEFLILLPESTPEEVKEVAEAMRAGVEQVEYPEISKDLKVTITCGTSYHEKKMLSQSLIDKVDKAMLRGKSEGRNRVIFY